MPTAADLAEWYEGKRRESEGILNDFVSDHPNWFGVIVAAGVKTCMDIGAGTVDVLRLGQGCAEGGWGYGRDALRLIGLVGPLGQGAKLARNAANAKFARMIVDPGGKICAWVAGCKALRQVGCKTFVAVEDLVKSLDQLLPQGLEIGPVTLSSMAGYLRMLGAKVGAVVETHTMDAVAKLVPKDGSVVMVAVAAVKGGKALETGHGFYAFRDVLGRLRLMDRSGVYSTLEELEKGYKAAHNIDGFVPTESLVVTNIFGKFMDATGKAGVLAMEVVPATGIDPKTADRAFRAYEKGRTGVPNNARFHRLQAGETLQSLATRYYNDAEKWPIIYAGNRMQIGDNPERLTPNKTIWIPDDKPN